MSSVALGLCVLATACADLRWFRVAQREHYLARAAVRFWFRWAASTPANIGLCVLAAAGAGTATLSPLTALGTAAVVGVWPIGLRLKGRTSKLAWTRRMSLVALVTGALEILAVAIAAVLAGLSGAVISAATTAFCAPLFVEAALAILRPLEEVLAERYVRRATELLTRVKPVVVGIAGSYGKTTTKNYVAHLLARDRSVVASPRSFNNRAGLTRTVNEHLTPGTEVLVAEMGAYGPGEIAKLCQWLSPQIAVITSIGPSHLERFGSLERTLEAKAEITSSAPVVVLNVDDVRLEGLAKRLDEAHKVVRVSGTDGAADVAVLSHAGGLELRLGGTTSLVVTLAPGTSEPIRTNAACAAAVAIQLGIDPETVAKRLGSLPSVPNRLQPHLAEGGYLVLDDTFNANPAGARHGVEVLTKAAPTGRRMLVTPGMVELGRSQRSENAAFAEAAAGAVTDVVIVGRSNRAALVEGYGREPTRSRLKLVGKREEAVAWARAQLGPGDAVLFENDLPDHFP